MPIVSNPSVITVLPDPYDQSLMHTFVTYQNTNGLGGILCESFPTCGKPLKLTLRCHMQVITISSVAVNPRVDATLPSHFILFSATNGNSKVLLSILICWISNCSRQTEVSIDQGKMEKLFASSTSITLTECIDGTWACALLTYTTKVSDNEDERTTNFINVVHCMNAGCTNFTKNARVVELGHHDDSPGPTYIALTGGMFPVISYFSFSEDSNNSTKGLKLSRCSTTDCGQDNKLTTNVITNATDTNFAMAAALYKSGAQSVNQIMMVYTSLDRTKLYAQSCSSKDCESTPMVFSKRLIWETSRNNATLSKPAVIMDYKGFAMVTFFEITKTASEVQNSIRIARCRDLECSSPYLRMVALLNETSVKSLWLAPQYLFYDPAVVYTRANHSLEYIRCQDAYCAKTPMHVCLDDAQPLADIAITPIEWESYIISSIVTLQLCLACLWLSIRGSKRPDFISKYVTTPYLSVVRLSPMTRSWLRFHALSSTICCIFCIIPWFIFAVVPSSAILDLLLPPILPALLGLITWLLFRKARAGTLVATKTIFLSCLWAMSTFAELWSMIRIFGIRLTDCSTINITSVKILNIIGGVGDILIAFTSIFLLNNIRLALKNTSPECVKLLDSGGNSRRRWMAPRANQNWVKAVTPRLIDDVNTPQRFEKQEHKRRMRAHQSIPYAPFQG